MQKKLPCPSTIFFLLRTLILIFAQRRNFLRFFLLLVHDVVWFPATISKLKVVVVLLQLHFQYAKGRLQFWDSQGEFSERSEWGRSPSSPDCSRLGALALDRTWLAHTKSSWKPACSWQAAKDKPLASFMFMYVRYKVILIAGFLVIICRIHTAFSQSFVVSS